MRAKKIPLYIFLTLVTIITVFPLYTVFVMGTYVSEDIFKGLPLFPGTYFIENCKTIVKSNFPLAYVNSLIVSISSVIISVLSSAMIGFALAKYEFKGKKIINTIVVVTMMIPGQISIIGFISEMRFMGLNNTLLPLIVGWVSNSFGAFFMLQFIKDSVPNEIIESARLDGCSELGIFFKIVLPFIKPGAMTLATLVFLWSWNSYLLPLIMLSKETLYTIPLAVSVLGTNYRMDYGAIMCALSFAIFPIIIVFCMASKTFIRGIAAGAVKG